MLKTENEIFDIILSEYSQLEKSFYHQKQWIEMSESKLWQELCLCILSSNVPYELAQSAFFHLIDIGYLSLMWIGKTKNSQKMIANELCQPIYLPRRLDGSYRKYRFPHTRSENIYQAARKVSLEEAWLSNLLSESTSETATRDFLVANISGLGLKQASHFLRNIRYSNQLAIIDSHIISFLIEIDAVPQKNVKTITRKTYLKLESVLQGICDQHNLDLSIFDMAIWKSMRRKG